MLKSIDFTLFLMNAKDDADVTQMDLVMCTILKHGIQT